MHDWLKKERLSTLHFPALCHLASPSLKSVWPISLFGPCLIPASWLQGTLDRIHGADTQIGYLNFLSLNPSPLDFPSPISAC